MTQRLPLNITHYDDKTVVTFIKHNGDNSVSTVLKYLIEEFPLAPVVELLTVISPEVEELLRNDIIQLEEVDSIDGVLTTKSLDTQLWDRVEDFRQSYKRWVKEVSSSRYI